MVIMRARATGRQYGNPLREAAADTAQTQLASQRDPLIGAVELLQMILCVTKV